MQNKFTHLCNCFEDLPRLPLEHWSKQNSNYARVNLRISVLKKLFAYYSPTTDSLTSSLSVFPWIPYLIWQKKVLESSISRFLILKLARLPGTISTLSRTHSTSLCRLFCLVPLSVLTRMATFLIFNCNNSELDLLNVFLNIFPIKLHILSDKYLLIFRFRRKGTCVLTRRIR